MNSTFSFLVIALFAFAMTSSAMAKDISFKSCGTSQDHLTVSAVDVTPYPAKAGAAVVLKIEGTLDAEMTEGNYDLEVSTFGITVLTKKGDICQLDPTKYPCPFKKCFDH